MSGGSFVLLEDRAVLSVSGPDRRAFLQGLVSNDVDKVTAETARYAAFLTAQGRYLHDFIMVAAGEAIWLDADAQRLDDLKRRLSVYRLRAKVTIDPRGDLAVAAIFGDAGAAALGLDTEPGAVQALGPGIVFVDPRLAVLGARAILPREAARAALGETGFSEAEFAAYDGLRLSLGVPDGSRDLVVDKSLLLESGFDELNGIDWQKGCYVGQELTARMKYRGLVRRRLTPVEIRGPVPAPGTIVTAEGREVGEVRSSRDRLGLALLRVEAIREGHRLTAGGADLVPIKPSWMRLDGDVAD